MQGGQKDPQNGRSETLPRTAHKTEAEEVAAAVGSEEAGMQGSSAADDCARSLRSRENWSSVETTGCLAGFYPFSPLPVGLQAAYEKTADCQRP